MFYKSKIIFLFAVIFIARWENMFSQSEKNSTRRELHWQNPFEEKQNNGQKISWISFDKAFYDVKTRLPYFFELLPLNNLTYIPSVKIINPVYGSLTDAEKSLCSGNLFAAEPVITSTIAYEKKKPLLSVSLIPFRKNAVTGEIEKLVSFDLVQEKSNSPLSVVNQEKLHTTATHSVLANGTWYKMGTTTNGVYKISRSFLSQLGMDVDNLNPASIRIFGNGGGLLPFLNAEPRPDDLNENAIYVYDGGSPGVFDQTDYILFYGQSATQWHYNPSDQKFHHQVHYYCDTAYYFITSDYSIGQPKRIQPQASSSQTPNVNVSSFDDYAYHEANLVNFVKSGREYFGESFDVDLNKNFSFFFPNKQDSVFVTCAFAIHSVDDTQPIGNDTSYFKISVSNQSIFKGSPPVCGSYTCDYATEGSYSNLFYYPGNTINIGMNFFPKYNSSVGYLNYIEVNTRRSLIWSISSGNDQMFFRDTRTSGIGNIASFSLSSAPVGLKLWDVTDPYNIREQQFNGGNGNFVLESDGTVHEFLGFGGNSFYTPKAVGKIDNQDLHGLANTDVIIVAHPSLLSQAQRLADFHSQHDNLTVNVVTTEQIYNEFSSGSIDVSAIRDFVKRSYDLSSGAFPRYVVLFGDGSYDNLGRNASNTNYIPTYESRNSTSLTGSFVTDDFFGLLDNSEGDPSNTELIDVGVGRLTVRSNDEAKIVVDKIIRYSTASQSGTVCAGGSSTLGDWRNYLCFIADDQDGTLHIGQADQLATGLAVSDPVYNIDKIYLDAYQQIVTPGGQTYPSVVDAINKRVEKGSLIINYTGHGGETGWAQEGVVSDNTITAWTNSSKMPVFMTATCEFSRWDDPGRTSAGEMVLLNANGGGIALLSTTRLVFSGPNAALNETMIGYTFTPLPSGEMPRLGDIYRLSKRDHPDNNSRNFSLLGDPALRIAYPKYNVIASTLNGNSISSGDTISALEKITITGYVSSNGQKLTNFNGYIYPTIFDKTDTLKTLQNDPDSGPYTFTMRKSIIYRGKAKVVNGDYSFTFIVPKDISYKFGRGKLSFYAENGTEDASGYNDSIIIGGSSGNVITDGSGPEIKLFMNDEKFAYGGTTNENPNIYAVLSDLSGINMVGNGIGHDLTATLDGKQDPVYILNDYYTSDLDSYQSGKILYPLKNIQEGRHSVKVKVWDINNNSSEAVTEFIVAPSAELALTHVLNYPNPFTTHTSFFFEHNQPCTGLNAQIQIFTVSGKLIKTLSKYIVCEGFRSDSITWDGRDDYGDHIGRGVYIYKLKIITPEGKSADHYEKLVVLK